MARPSRPAPRRVRGARRRSAAPWILIVVVLLIAAVLVWRTQGRPRRGLEMTPKLKSLVEEWKQSQPPPGSRAAQMRQAARSPQRRGAGRRAPAASRQQ